MEGQEAPFTYSVFDVISVDFYFVVFDNIVWNYFFEYLEMEMRDFPTC